MIRSTGTRAFPSIHAHGFLRVAAATPISTVASPTRCCETIAEQMIEASRTRCDLVVFPELAISSYAIGDLVQQDALLDEVEGGLAMLMTTSRSSRTVFVVGAPLRHGGSLFNCAIILHEGAILGVVPKTFLPNNREYYEKRWFATGENVVATTISLLGDEVLFGVDLLFKASSLPGFVIHVEICEDLWSPQPPSTSGALAGAFLLCNLSASNATIGKARERHRLCSAQSLRTASVYVYSAAGTGESSTDVCWDGQSCIYELGELLIESERFSRTSQLRLVDVDLDRIRQERMRSQTFQDAIVFSGRPECRFRTVLFPCAPAEDNVGLKRDVARYPFIPGDEGRLDEDCAEAFDIQVHALARRFEATGRSRMILGVSGGIDSAHALVVAAKACDVMGLPRSCVIAVSLPSFATSVATRANALDLMRALAVSEEEIDIRSTATEMLSGLGHGHSADKPIHDVVFENVQAGLRTDFLFRLANQRDGFVLGTGDMTELALGWCTYGVGDQMSHYAVNSGLPKTLIQFLMRWVVLSGQFEPDVASILSAVLATRVSPELIPSGDDGLLQDTEASIGPFALNDFFLHHTLRWGQRPAKIAFLAWHAWHDVSVGRWPPGLPETMRRSYDLDQIDHWLHRFLERFFTASQFKRSASPDGPKVSPGGALSPRGDWRAPSDATDLAWAHHPR